MPGVDAPLREVADRHFSIARSFPELFHELKQFHKLLAATRDSQSSIFLPDAPANGALTLSRIFQLPGEHSEAPLGPNLSLRHHQDTLLPAFCSLRPVGRVLPVHSMMSKYSVIPLSSGADQSFCSDSRNS